MHGRVLKLQTAGQEKEEGGHQEDQHVVNAIQQEYLLTWSSPQVNKHWGFSNA